MLFGKSRLTVVVLLAALSAGAQTASENKTTQPVPATTATATAAADDGGAPVYIRPETPEQRKARLGTAEDPGPDPDPKTIYWRFGKKYHIEKFERRWAKYDQEEGWVRPMAMVNFAKEIYQQNDKSVWVWILEPESVAELQETTPIPNASRFNAATIKFLKSVRGDFTKLWPADSETVVRFAESSGGLPVSGSWRNSVAVADLNDDGFPDIIAPPERGAGGRYPTIFLGDGHGHWRTWTDVTWPHSVDYGGVVTADFNHDGHMDAAFAVHLNGVYVFLGDGKGHFTEVLEGLPRDYPTRRLVAMDADGDGYMDLAVISEGPTMRTDANASRSKLLVLMNRDKGRRWETMNGAPANLGFGGDFLAAGDLNGDKVPDFVASSVYFGNQDIVHLSQNGKPAWKPFESDGALIPSLSYYWANTAGRFSSSSRSDAIVSYVHYWPSDLESHVIPKPELMEVVNIDRIAIRNGKLIRTPIARWGSNRPVSGMATADFDGDGNMDFIYSRSDPREAVLMLGDGKGGFKRAKIEGLPLEPMTNYDIQVADVNGDRRPDVILAYEATETTALGTRNGSIHVFLNTGSGGRS